MLVLKLVYLSFTTMLKSSLEDSYSLKLARVVTRVSVAVTVPGAKATWKGRDLFPLIPLGSHSITKGRQGGTRGTELEAVTKAGTTEECYLLAC